VAESTIGGLKCVVIFQYIQGPGAGLHNVPDAAPHKVPGAVPHSATQRRTRCLVQHRLCMSYCTGGNASTIEMSLGIEGTI